MRNHSKWVCFLAIGAAALREKAKEEWDRRFPQQPWNDNDPTQISKLIQTEQAACNGKLPKPSLNHLTTIQNQGPDFQNWDMTSLTYMLTQTRCLDLRNTDPQLFQAAEQLKNLRNQFAHLPDPFGVSDNRLKAIHQDFENALAGLSLTTFARYQQELRSILDEPAPVDFKAVVDNLNKEKQETSSKNATLQNENENLKSSNFIWKVYAFVMTIMVAMFAFIKLVNTPTFRKIISILLRVLYI